MSHQDGEDISLSRLEASLLFEGIYQRYGYDFREYSEVSRLRRLLAILSDFGVDNLGTLQHLLLANEDRFREFLKQITVTTSEMFRDPAFFLELRQSIFPILRTYPSFRIWHAGCSSGEEVYSLAIMLAEEGMLDRATIYATDINPLAIARAKSGIYAKDRLRDFSKNYLGAGGTGSLSTYFHVDAQHAMIDPVLTSKIVFYEHNLASDEVFSEIHLLLCRNVLIYFDKSLQDRALDLMRRSLARDGILCLGSQETLQFSNIGEFFRSVSGRYRIYALEDQRDQANYVFSGGGERG